MPYKETPHDEDFHTHHLLFILFGPAGVGKSFVGKILEENFQFHFYDADIDLTSEMVEAIQKQKTFTQEMRNHYFKKVCQQIKKLTQKYKRLAVAQALAKEINRHQVLALFPQAKFILIETNESLVNTRLIKRNDWITPEYAKKIRILFEKPQIKYTLINNNFDKPHIDNQLKFLMQQINR